MHALGIPGIILRHLIGTNGPRVQIAVENPHILSVDRHLSPPGHPFLPVRDLPVTHSL